MGAPEKKQKAQSNRLVVLIFAVLLLVISVVVFVVYRRTPKDTASRSFNANTPKTTVRLYNSIAERDLDTDYPNTPEEVMQFYLDTVRLFYGLEMLQDEQLELVLQQQRKLYASDFLDVNPYEEQLANLKASVTALHEMGVIVIASEQKPPYYYIDNSMDDCLIRITQYINGSDNLFRNYFLLKNKESRRWEIISWEETDENFTSELLQELS